LDGTPKILGVVAGVVEHGAKLGRRLGFPTANVRLPDTFGGKHGVYATRTLLPDGRRIDGVASVGVSGSVGKKSPLLEVWLFGLDEDLYGQRIRTELVAFLREMRDFGDLQTLVAQVRTDAAQARVALANAAATNEA